MNRTLYSALWWVALPAVLGRLWWRGRKEPGYRAHWGERLALDGPAPGERPTIMVHAVSVGETRAAEPVVDALLAAYPDCRILLTHMTPTGRATGKSLFAHHGERVVQSYLPYDTGVMTRRFLRRHRPRACILMETEVWPNLIHACRQLEVPIVLANARLSEKSLKRGRKAGTVMLEAARGFTLVAAQTELDAERIRSLGAPNVVVTGSVKFDVTPPPAALEKGDWLRSRILELATIEAARSIGMDDQIGSITPGKRADLILLDPGALNMALAGDADPYTLIVYSATPANVDTVIVDGVVLKRGGRLLGVDVPRVMKEARASIDAILERAGAPR